MSAGLNPDQLRAVTHGAGPLLIVAGPGSGKTRVIIERVIHLVKSGATPSEMLCLTFSEKAAEEMRQRLEKEMDVSDMEISTFHAFAKDILEDNVLDSGALQYLDTDMEALMDSGQFGADGDFFCGSGYVPEVDKPEGDFAGGTGNFNEHGQPAVADFSDAG